MPAVNRHTGKRLWSKPMLKYSKNPLNANARTSPAIAGDLLIFGNYYNKAIAASTGLKLGNGATLYAVDRADGELVWRTKLDGHPFAQVTQSPVVHAGRIYVGVASQEVLAARSLLYHSCCTFRGSMLALDAVS